VTDLRPKRLRWHTVALAALGLVAALGLARAVTKEKEDKAKLDTAPKGDRPAGFRKFSFSYTAPDGDRRERSVFLWYPTAKEATRFDYKWQVGFVASDAPLADGKQPLLLFSHGFLGSADQTIFLMEELARHGYVVAALDHADAGRKRKKSAPWPNFLDAKSWDEKKYLDRRQDLGALLDHLLDLDKQKDSFLYQHVNAKQIGALGHSLGGYTVLGMVGAWPSWRDERVQAALLLSPYTMPLQLNGKPAEVKAPVMLQGGTLDFGITPFLPGLYAKLAGPKHYLVLKNETHFGWTNLISLGKTTTDCVKSGNAELITNYAVAFFDQYLKGIKATILEENNARLESYEFAAPKSP
jgi:predicted dienelactone hydrolase